jgi:hypothetical protein
MKSGRVFLALSILMCLGQVVLATDDQPSTNKSPANLVLVVADKTSGILVGALSDKKSLEAWWEGESEHPKKRWWTWAKGPHTGDQPTEVIAGIQIHDDIVHVSLQTGETILFELRTGKQTKPRTAKQTSGGDSSTRADAGLEPPQK